MSAKMANVIAVELAILIAVLIWLGISRVPSVQLHPTVEARAPADDSFAVGAPLPRARSQNLDATNDDASGDGSTEVFEEQVQTAPEYVQEPVAEPYPSSAYGEEFVAESEPYYAAAYQEPVVSSPDYYVAPVQQIVEFVQPSQIIVVSNPRSCERPHPRATPSCDPPLTVGRQVPGTGTVPTRGGEVPPRQNADGGLAPQQPANGGLAPRQPANGGLAPRRPANGGLAPRQPVNGGLVPRQIVSARAVPQKQGLKTRFDP